MTPDVNVLVAAYRDDHQHHGVARDWITDALDQAANGGRFSLLPMVAAGVLRVVTHPQVFKDAPTPAAEAADFLAKLQTSPGVVTAPLGEELALLMRLCATYGLVGNAVPDAWIAAAVRTRGERLATFDRGFARLLSPAELELLADPPQPAQR